MVTIVVVVVVIIITAANSGRQENRVQAVLASAVNKATADHSHDHNDSDDHHDYYDNNNDYHYNDDHKGSILQNSLSAANF
jgi:hypothetical protein